MQRVPSIPYTDPFAEEAVIHQYFKDNWTDNPKKLKKMAARLALDENVPLHLVTGILLSVARTSNPVGYLKECFKQHTDYSILIPQFMEEGHHGIIWKDKELFPISVHTNRKWMRKDDKWNPSQEVEIMEAAVKEWMIAYGKKKFDGKVMLFAEFGFTGKFRAIKLDVA